MGLAITHLERTPAASDGLAAGNRLRLAVPRYAEILVLMLPAILFALLAFMSVDRHPSAPHRHVAERTARSP